jgi:hypothetical protein
MTRYPDIVLRAREHARALVRIKNIVRDSRIEIEERSFT